MNSRFNRNLSNIRERISFECHPTLNERLRTFEANVENLGDTILNLTFGYPEDLQTDWMRDIEVNLDFKTLDALQKKPLKKSIQNYFSKLFHVEDIYLTTSASEALMIAIHSCILNRDDEIILFDYGFYTYPALIKTGKGKPVFAERKENGEPNFKNVKDCITNKTRAILVTQPENPLGRIYSREELENLCMICKENNLTLIVDHSFIESSPFGNEISMLTELKENSFLKNLSWIVIGDTGKILCLHGVKYACLLSSEDYKEAIDNWLHLILFQFDLARMHILSTILNDSRLDEYKLLLNKGVADNYNLLEERIDPRVKVFRPQATPMVLVDVGYFGLDDISLVEKILLEEKVAIMPGSYFVQATEDNAYYSKNHVRIAISRPREKIEEAILRINRCLAKLSV